MQGVTAFPVTYLRTKLGNCTEVVNVTGISVRLYFN